MKRLLYAVLILALCLSLLMGCQEPVEENVAEVEQGQEQEVNGEKPTITLFIQAQELEKENYLEALKRFEEENNCIVDLQVGGDQYWPELEGALAAETEPDVFYLTIEGIQKRVWTDKIVPLNDYIDVENLGIWQTVLDFYKYDLDTDTKGQGLQYGLPKDFAAYSLAINTAIVDKRSAEVQELVDNGVIPYYPEPDENGNLPVYTFTEFANLCKALTFVDETLPDTVNSKQVYGTHLWEWWCLPPFIWGAGGDYINEDDTKVLFNSPEFIEGYEGFMKPVEMGGSGMSTDETNGYLKILAGRSAIFPCGTWDVGAFQAIEDDATINPNKEWFDFELFPWPISDKYADLSIAERQDKWYAGITSVGYCVSKNSPHKDLAAKLVYFISGDEEIVRFLAQNGGQVPNIEEMAKGEYLTDDAYNPENREIFIRIMSGENGQLMPFNRAFNSRWIGEGLMPGTAGVWNYYEGIDNGGVELMSVEDYLNSIQAEAQRLLDESISDTDDLRP